MVVSPTYCAHAVPFAVHPRNANRIVKCSIHLKQESDLVGLLPEYKLYIITRAPLVHESIALALQNGWHHSILHELAQPVEGCNLYSSSRKTSWPVWFQPLRESIPKGTPTCDCFCSLKLISFWQLPHLARWCKSRFVLWIYGKMWWTQLLPELDNIKMSTRC